MSGKISTINPINNTFLYRLSIKTYRDKALFVH